VKAPVMKKNDPVYRTTITSGQAVMKVTAMDRQQNWHYCRGNSNARSKTPLLSSTHTVKLVITILALVLITFVWNFSWKNMG
jgi:hypothetical protein